MRGLHVAAGTVQYREDLATPSDAPGECRVRVVQAGVCATDLALVRGYMDFEGIPGHEFVGRAVDGPYAGQRVVGEINAACGACVDCHAGRGRHCAYRTVLGILGRSGAFAEELVLPVANLLPVPDGVSDEAATFVEPLAAARHILDQVEVRAGMRALVVGDGRLGLLCGAVLQQAGAEVSFAGRHPERVERLALPLTWLDEPAPKSFDLVVEASGRPETFALALGCVRPLGTLALKTTTERAASLDLTPLVVDEITLVGSRCGAFAPALQWLVERRFPVENLVDARFPLADGAQALAVAGRRGTLKVLLEVDGP
jgi:threonine dehydrogenase-like Zn-dependent dehydrogenase